MILVICELPLQELIWQRFAVVREIEEMKQIRLFLLHRFPAEVDNVLEFEQLMVLFPTVPDKDRIGIGKRNELEL